MTDIPTTMEERPQTAHDEAAENHTAQPDAASGTADLARPVFKATGKVNAAGVLAALAMAAVVAVMITGLLLALQSYRVRDGLFGSEWVMLKNFQFFIQSNFFTRTLSNTFTLRAIQIIIGFALGIPLAFAVSAPRKPGRVLTLSALFLVPVCLPYISSMQMAFELLPTQMRVSEEGIYSTFSLSVLLQTAGMVAFCGGFFSYLKRSEIGGGVMQGIWVALLLSLLCALSPENDSLSLLQNAMNLNLSDTLDTYGFRISMQQANYSYGSAVNVLMLAAQMLLAVIPALLLCRTARRDESRTPLAPADAARVTFGLAKIIWLCAIAAAFAVTFGVNMLMNKPEQSLAAVQTALSNDLIPGALCVSALTALLGGALAATVAAGILNLYGGGRSGFGFAAVLLSSSMVCVTGQYLLFRACGMTNTLWPVVLRQVFSPRLIALTLLLVTVTRMVGARARKGVWLALFCLSAAFAWGDYQSGLLHTYSREMYSLPLMLRTILLGDASLTAGSADMTEVQLLAQRAAVLLMTALVSLPAVLFGFGGAFFFIRAFRDLK